MQIFLNYEDIEEMIHGILHKMQMYIIAQHLTIYDCFSPSSPFCSSSNTLLRLSMVR